MHTRVHVCACTATKIRDFAHAGLFILCFCAKALAAKVRNVRMHVCIHGNFCAKLLAANARNVPMHVCIHGSFCAKLLGAKVRNVSMHVCIHGCIL